MNNLEPDIRQTMDFVFKVIRGFVRDLETAKDITQQVMLKILKNQHGFEGQSRFKTWVYRVAVNAAMDHFRRPRLNLLWVWWYDREPPQEDLKNDVRRALVKLAEDKRDVLVLHFFLGFKIQEIAEKLGIPLGTANSRFERAKAEFKTVLQELGYEYE